MNTPPTKTCTFCSEVMPADAAVCPRCGAPAGAAPDSNSQYAAAPTMMAPRMEFPVEPPAPEPAPEPIPEPTPEPIPEPTPEPTPEPAYEPAFTAPPEPPAAPAYTPVSPQPSFTPPPPPPPFVAAAPKSGGIPTWVWIVVVVVVVLLCLCCGCGALGYYMSTRTQTLINPASLMAIAKMATAIF